MQWKVCVCVCRCSYIKTRHPVTRQDTVQCDQSLNLEGRGMFLMDGEHACVWVFQNRGPELQSIIHNDAFAHACRRHSGLTTQDLYDIHAVARSAVAVASVGRRGADSRHVRLVLRRSSNCRDEHRVACAVAEAQCTCGAAGGAIPEIPKHQPTLQRRNLLRQPNGFLSLRI